MNQIDMTEYKQALIAGIGIAVRQAIDTPPRYCTDICIPDNPTGRDCNACGRMAISREAREEMANEIVSFFGRKGEGVC